MKGFNKHFLVKGLGGVQCDTAGNHILDHEINDSLKILIIVMQFVEASS